MNKMSKMTFNEDKEIHVDRQTKDGTKFYKSGGYTYSNTTFRGKHTKTKKHIKRTKYVVDYATRIMTKFVGYVEFDNPTEFISGFSEPTKYNPYDTEKLLKKLSKSKVDEWIVWKFPDDEEEYLEIGRRPHERFYTGSSNDANIIHNGSSDDLSIFPPKMDASHSFLSNLGSNKPDFVISDNLGSITSASVGSNTLDASGNYTFTTFDDDDTNWTTSTGVNKTINKNNEKEEIEMKYCEECGQKVREIDCWYCKQTVGSVQQKQIYIDSEHGRRGTLGKYKIGNKKAILHKSCSAKLRDDKDLMIKLTRPVSYHAWNIRNKLSPIFQKIGWFLLIVFVLSLISATMLTPIYLLVNPFTFGFAADSTIVERLPHMWFLAGGMVGLIAWVIYICVIFVEITNYLFNPTISEDWEKLD